MFRSSLYTVHVGIWVSLYRNFPDAEFQKLKAKSVTGLFEKHHREELGKLPAEWDLGEYIWTLQLQTAGYITTMQRQPCSLISDREVRSLLLYWGKWYICVRSRSRKFGVSWRLCWPPQTPSITQGGNSWLHSCFVFSQCMVNIHSLTVAATFGLFCIINEFIPEIRTVASLTFFSEASDIGQGQILEFLDQLGNSSLFY